ncbi:MAG: dynamin family protein [Nostoc sp. DedQUE12b]|uniref:dynamin family protein n=1 Tax=Nostoc sp. DedQUE12b TaxID=3075398 RepID=UPI002AD2C5D9|nr:dynamin family protein [Nostoc sp. DedQUE12b]MDZ8087912.1 dynamin family protein [Nostoc sp. DedQUE12b]
MDTSLVNSQTVELFSQITGQKLTKKNLTPPVIFLANLVTVLLGVIFVDGTVAESEKQRLLTTLYRFSNPESDVRKLTHLMIKGVKDNQVYKQVNSLLALAAPLSESEKLLLISFGYEMSAANGEIDPHEKKYLEMIGNQLGIKPQHLAILEAAFIHQENVEFAALNEVNFLLNTARFQELDNIFVKAANDILAALPAKPETKVTGQHSNISYRELAKFKENRQQLETYCNQIYQVLKDCNERSFLPHTLIEEIEEVFKKIKSQRFRLAVVGEFSKGKSTLLNALLGEEIQPVRAIPCSGTVTVLKYGIKKRVFCRYKDGRYEEIPFEQYKVKAAISREAATEHRSDELAQSDIEEIIFEHPELLLCKSGVEILDSPGLNEHPDRTSITYKLLKNTDAVIFLTDAMHLLSEKEKELIQDVRYQLNGNHEYQPAENLFILVNFMDSLEEEEDRQDVRQRLESFIKNKNLLISNGEHRVHYISAKASLKAILNNRIDDEYLKNFHTFTQSLEKFLTIERGYLQNKQFVNKINGRIQAGLDGLRQAKDTLDGNIKLSEAGKLEILEQIGEASGRDVRIQVLANEVRDLALEEANKSWHEWIEGLIERLANKLEHWTSSHNPIFSQQQLRQDYVNQFIRDLQNEIDIWGEKELKNKILKPHFEFLDKCINEELNALRDRLQVIDKEVNTDFSKQINLAINDIGDSFGDLFSYISGGLFAGGLGAGLLMLLGLGGPIMWAVTGVGAAIAGALGFGMSGIHDQIKLKVFKTGCEKFAKSTEQLTDKIGETIGLVFDNRIEAAVKVIEKAICLCENLLEQQEKAHNETLEQREAEKMWIYQKREELEQVQNGLEVILSKCTIV